MNDDWRRSAVEKKLKWLTVLYLTVGSHGNLANQKKDTNKNKEELCDDK